MAPAYDHLQDRLAAAAATVVPGPLLESQEASRLREGGMRAGCRTVGTTRVRYAESQGPAEQTVLLTSPWPESMYAFAPVWPALASRFRVLAVDVHGVDASGPPARLRAPHAMGAFLIRLIEEWDLNRPHLVAPDAGGLAALFATLLSPRAVRTVVVGTGCAAVPPELTGRLGEIEAPVLVFAGLRDRIVSLTNADLLAERLCDCRVATFGTGHFVWEESPDAFAQLLGEWIEEHG